MAFNFCRAITIDHTKCGSSNSSNFPVLFSGTYSWLKTTANGGNIQNASGFDIGFFSDAALTTALNFEFEAGSYNASTGAVNFWINVPTASSSADTVIYIAYGNPSITTDKSSTSTWDSNFKGAYHLPDGPTLTANDSTSNALNLTNNA